jgi:hypothetical protein
MRILTLGLAVALCASAAAAQPINENPPTRTIQCIETGGQLVPAVCRTPASRLDTREYICTCPNGGMRTEVSICAKGQAAPAEGKALNIARAAGMKDGTLVGDTVNGKPICAPPRRGY